MARLDPRLTPQLEQTIVAYVRAGGLPHVAAEAAGVPYALFRRWMQRGDGKDARPAYRHFRRAVHQAHAQARLGAEVAVFKGKPLDWLKCGPGREAPGRTGWTSAAKAPPAARGEAAPTLSHPEVQRLLVELLEQLKPFPEARAAVAGKLARGAPDRPRPGH
jgi:hypothetical protein